MGKEVPDSKTTLVPLGRSRFVIRAQDLEHVRDGRSRLFTITQVGNDVRDHYRIDVAHLRRRVLEEAIRQQRMWPPPYDPCLEKFTRVAICDQEVAIVRNWPARDGKRNRGDRSVVDVKRCVVMHWLVTRRVTPQTIRGHFAFEKIKGARSYAFGGWRDRQHPRRQRSREDTGFTNTLATHLGCGRNLDREFATGKLRGLQIGQSLFNRGAEFLRVPQIV